MKLYGFMLVNYAMERPVIISKRIHKQEISIQTIKLEFNKHLINMLGLLRYGIYQEMYL